MVICRKKAAILGGRWQRHAMKIFMSDVSFARVRPGFSSLSPQRAVMTAERLCPDRPFWSLWAFLFRHSHACASLWVAGE